MLGGFIVLALVLGNVDLYKVDEIKECQFLALVNKYWCYYKHIKVRGENIQ